MIKEMWDVAGKIPGFGKSRTPTRGNPKYCNLCGKEPTEASPLVWCKQCELYVHRDENNELSWEFDGGIYDPKMPLSTANSGHTVLTINLECGHVLARKILEKSQAQDKYGRRVSM